MRDGTNIGFVTDIEFETCEGKIVALVVGDCAALGFSKTEEVVIPWCKIVRIGGVAIYLAFIITMALYVKTDMAMNGILIGSTIMFIGGLVDDLVNLKPLYKFSFQVVAAIVLIASGVTMSSGFRWASRSTWASSPSS